MTREEHLALAEECARYAKAEFAVEHFTRANYYTQMALVHVEMAMALK